jgi:hypothetical protein
LTRNKFFALLKSEKTRLFLVFSLLAANLSWVYSTRIELPNWQLREALEQAILKGTADSPFAYRVAIPYLADWLSSLTLVLGLAEFQSHQAAYLILNFLSVFLILFLTARLSRVKSFSDLTLMSLLVFVGLNAGLYDHVYAPWSLPEVAIWLFAFTLIRNHAHLIIIIAPLATLVRETGVLIPLVTSLWVLLTGENGSTPPRRNVYLWAALAGLLSLFTDIVIRVKAGPRANDIELLEIFQINISQTGIRQFVFNAILMLGLFLVLSLKTSFLHKPRGRPDELMAILSFAPYLLAVATFAIWYEVRLLMVLVPFLSIYAVRRLARPD